MSIGKVVKFAGSHRILYALSFGAKGSKELKLIVGAINSIARFDGEYMGRLVENGYVRQVTGGWAITAAGQARLEELGPVPGLDPNKKGRGTDVYDRPIYQPSKELQTPMRPGSEDALQYPSRMGDNLFYRDGRVEKIEEKSDGH